MKAISINNLQTSSASVFCQPIRSEAIQLPAELAILELEAGVKILSLVLALGFLTVIMAVVGVVHMLCYEKRKPKVRAVLNGQKKPANIDYTLV